MGDSITAAWYAYQANVPDNFGVAGNTTAMMLARFKAEVIEAADPVGVVVIGGGINDWLHSDGTPVTTANIAAMAKMASEAGIRVIIASVMLADFSAGEIVINPTAADIDAFNDALIKLCAENGYLYADYRDEMVNADGSVDMDLYKDGLHPNEAGYNKMWKVLEPLINEDLAI